MVSTTRATSLSANTWGGFLLDVANEPAVHHVLWHGGLEGAVADKEDDGVKLVVRQPQQGFERHHVQVVLAQGVLKAVPVAIDLLVQLLWAGLPKIQPFMFLVSMTKTPKRETIT